MRDPVYWPEINLRTFEDWPLNRFHVRISSCRRYKYKSKWWIEEVVINKHCELRNFDRMYVEAISECIKNANSEFIKEMHFAQKFGKPSNLRIEDPCQDDEYDRIVKRYPERRLGGRKLNKPNV